MKDVAPYGSSILIAYMIAFVDLCGFGLLLPLLPCERQDNLSSLSLSLSPLSLSLSDQLCRLFQPLTWIRRRLAVRHRLWVSSGCIFLGASHRRGHFRVAVGPVGSKSSAACVAGGQCRLLLSHRHSHDTTASDCMPRVCRAVCQCRRDCECVCVGRDDRSDAIKVRTRRGGGRGGSLFSCRYMGLLGGVFAAGFVSGPAIGGFLGSSFGVLLGFKVASYVAGGVCLLNLVFCFFFFRNADAPSPPEEKLSNDDNANDGAGAREKNDTKRESLWKGVRTAFRQRVLVALFVSTFFVSLCVTIMESAIALFLKDVYDYPEKYAGVLFAVFGVIMALTLIVAFQPLMRLVGPVNILRLAALLLAGLSASIPIVPSLNAIYVLLSGFAVANGVVGSSFSVLTSNLAKGSFGSVLGIRRSFGSLARALGPFLAGSLYDLTVLSTDLPHSIPFFVAGSKPS